MGFALANGDWLGRTIAFYQVFFKQGRVALGKWCIGPQKGHPRTPGMEFFLYSAPASFSWLRIDLARLLRRAYSQSVWIISFEFVKVCGIRFSHEKTHRACTVSIPESSIQFLIILL